MENLVSQIQKNILAFCQLLPEYVDKWGVIMQYVEKPLQNLENLTEQFRHVHSVEKLNCIDDFESTKQVLQTKIMELIEEEMTVIKCSIDQLMNLNFTLKNKLFGLERLTESLDWDRRDCLVVTGNGYQPPLRKLLEKSLDFYEYFSNCGRIISENYKKIDLKNENSVKVLRKSFSIRLSDERVVELVALTQYVNHTEKVS